MGLARQPAARRRSVRLAVVAGLAGLALWAASAASGGRGAASQAAAGRRRLEAQPQQARAAGGSSGEGALGQPRGKYALPQHELEALVAAASEVHGQVPKAGPLPAEHWADARRPARERAFLELLLRGAWRGDAGACGSPGCARPCGGRRLGGQPAGRGCHRARALHLAAPPPARCCPTLPQPPSPQSITIQLTTHPTTPLAEQRWRSRVGAALSARNQLPKPSSPNRPADMAEPRSAQYWAADAVSGELALRPLRRPYPLCHLYVNHRYRIIFIVHPNR